MGWRPRLWDPRGPRSVTTPWSRVMQDMEAASGTGVRAMTFDVLADNEYLALLYARESCKERLVGGRRWAALCLLALRRAREQPLDDCLCVRPEATPLPRVTSVGHIISLSSAPSFFHRSVRCRAHTVRPVPCRRPIRVGGRRIDGRAAPAGHGGVLNGASDRSRPRRALAAPGTWLCASESCLDGSGLGNSFVRTGPPYGKPTHDPGTSAAAPDASGATFRETWRALTTAPPKNSPKHGCAVVFAPATRMGAH